MVNLIEERISSVLTSSDEHQTDQQSTGVQKQFQGRNQQMLHERKLHLSPV